MFARKCLLICDLLFMDMDLYSVLWNVVVLGKNVCKVNGKNKKRNGNECNCSLLMQLHHSSEQVRNVYEMKVIEPKVIPQ